ncbi:MAG: hypothetical protein HQ581_26920, partial [Planctomycetes bacterium]|nr:hypothetical protein [Planctomycetota bacterium]
LSRPHDVELQGTVAFVPGKGGSLAVVDVADPENPEILWYRHDTQELFDAETVLPLGDYLLLGTNDLISIDVTNPRAPRFLTTISDRDRISRINGMVRRGDRVFAASKDGWVDVFDIANPSAPTFVGAFNTRENGKLQSPHDIDVFGGHVVVVDPAGFGRRGLPGKVGLYRVADTITREPLPVERWPLVGVLVSDDLMGANRVQVRGHYAFVGGSQGDKPSNAVTVDISDPAQPVQAAVVRFSDTRGPNGLTIAGDVLFLAGGQTVEAIDVRNPAKPVKLASYTCDEAFPAGRDSAHDLVYRDGYLYVTGQNDNCLCILRVDSPLIRNLAARP